MRFCPLTSCSMRPRIGIAWSSIFCSSPTRANALRPRAESAKLILRPWTNSAVRMSGWMESTILRRRKITTLDIISELRLRFSSYLPDTRINVRHVLSSPNAMLPVSQPVRIWMRYSTCYCFHFGQNSQSIHFIAILNGICFGELCLWHSWQTFIDRFEILQIFRILD